MMNFTKIKKKAVIVGALVVALSAVGITYALLSSSSQQNVNKFEGAAAKVNIAVIEQGRPHEDGSNNQEGYIYNQGKPVTKEVSIKNINDPSYPTTDCYIRVKFIPMLTDSEVSDKPDTYIGKQLDITYNLNKESNHWVYDSESDTYYYTEPVAPDASTELLLKSVIINEKLPLDSQVKIEVIADAISAHPDTNLKNAWGLTNQNGNYFSSFTPINQK